MKARGVTPRDISGTAPGPSICGQCARTRMRCVLKGFWIVVLLLPWTAPGFAANPPGFKLKDVDGTWQSLQDHLGREVVYISFWATWCVPCRREMPHLEKLYEDHRDQGFTVLSINTDPPSNRSKIKPFLARYKLSYPCLLDPDNNVHDTYNPTRELPYAVLVDRNGDVVKTYAGYRAGDEKILRDDVQRLLAQSDGGAGTGTGSDVAE